VIEGDGEDVSEPIDNPTLRIGDIEHPRVALAGAGLAALVAFVAFVAHVLPGVGFWDTGIFQAAAPTLGLTHPTGYPTFLLAGWAFTNLAPIGDPAFRMDLLSTIYGALAVGALAMLIRWLGVSSIVAAAGALTFAFLQQFWRTAVRADPHVLHVLFVIALLLLVLEWRRRNHDPRWLTATGLVFGLSLGNHLLTLLVGPALAVLVLWSKPRIVLDWRRMAVPLAALLAGAAIYLYVPLRAAANPPIHHDFAPTTWSLFWRYVLGSDFQGSMGFLTVDGPRRAIGQLPVFIASLQTGGTAPIAIGILVLAAIGLVGLARTDPAVAVLLLLAGGLTLYASLTYANGDLERYYFVPVALLVACAALGTQLLLWATVPALPSFAEAAPLVLLVPVVLAATNAPRVDNRPATCFADAALDDVAPNAVVMSWWTYTTPLWYERFVIGKRPDVEVYNGIDLVPGELDRRFGQGRPIYLIQSDSTIEQIEQHYTLQRIDACGVTMLEVTGRRTG
jgi:hypothetical protein